ncbi:MAG: hypothetical protein ABIH11_01155 [Candidatus Altiarchaeota archaeon]
MQEEYGMKAMIMSLTALLVLSGCLCNMGAEDCLDADSNGVCDNEEKATSTTVKTTSTTNMPTLPPLPADTTIETITTTLGPTTTTLSMAECVGQYQVQSNEVIFLYTTSCCASLHNTVNQLGSLKFEKMELTVIDPRERNILGCLGITDVKEISLARLYCPFNSESMYIPKEEFAGARDRIRDFTLKCKEDSLKDA